MCVVLCCSVFCVYVSVCLYVCMSGWLPACLPVCLSVCVRDTNYLSAVFCSGLPPSSVTALSKFITNQPVGEALIQGVSPHPVLHAVLRHSLSVRMTVRDRDLGFRCSPGHCE